MDSWTIFYLCLVCNFYVTRCQRVENYDLYRKVKGHTAVEQFPYLNKDSGDIRLFVQKNSFLLKKQYKIWVKNQTNRGTSNSKSYSGLVGIFCHIHTDKKLMRARMK